MRDRDLLERARAEAFRLAEAGAPPPVRSRALPRAGGWERRFGLARVG